MKKIKNYGNNYQNRVKEFIFCFHINKAISSPKFFRNKIQIMNIISLLIWSFLIVHGFKQIRYYKFWKEKDISNMFVLKVINLFIGDTIIIMKKLWVLLNQSHFLWDNIRKMNLKLNLLNKETYKIKNN